MVKKSFISGALILVLTGFITKIFGFIYRIYLSNVIGAEGMGLFQLIYPIYSLIILTLTAGISIAVSKMTAAELAKGRLINIRRITKYALVIVVSAAIFVSFFVFLNVNYIANSILKDWRTYYSLLILVPCIPIIAFGSAIRGYFYGIQEIVPTAISQIVEQIVRIGFVVIVTSMLVGVDLEYSCAIITLGTALGEIANLLVLLIVYKYKKVKIDKISKTDKLPRFNIVKEIIFTAIPISFNRFITSIMTAIETILIPMMLVVSGMTHQQSMSMLGKMTAMAMPVLFFPAIVTSSLAITLVPAISEAISLGKLKLANYRISKSIELTAALGFIFAAIFLCYSNEISGMIYKRENVGDLLYSLAITCIFIYLQQTLLGILNGLGKQTISLINSIAGYVIRIAFIYIFMPRYGIWGYIWGVTVSSVITCILNLFSVMKSTNMKLDIKNWILKPGIIGVVIFLCGKYIYSFATIFNLRSSYTTLTAVILELIIALQLMILVGILDKDEIIKLFSLKKHQ